MLRSWAGHTAAIWSVAFSPDGRQVVTAAEDQALRMWLVDIDDLLDFVGEHPQYDDICLLCVRRT